MGPLYRVVAIGRSYGPSGFPLKDLQKAFEWPSKGLLKGLEALALPELVRPRAQK